MKAEKEQKELRVSRVYIKNILGIQLLEFRPGAGLTVITGENAGGKTSAQEAIKSVFKGGQDVTLLRKGTDKGEIVLELSDGVKIERTVTATKSATMITHPEFGQISKPAAFLEQLIDKLGMNPVDFLTAPAKMRTQLLLEAMPIKLDSALIEPIIGHTVDELDTNALELIDREHKRFYDDRTGVNRVAKEKRATILQMKQTLPAEDEDTDWARVVRSTEVQLNQHGEKTALLINQSKDKIIVSKSEVNYNGTAELERIKDERDQRIADIQKEAQEKIDAVQAKARADCDQIQETGQADLNTIQTYAQPERDTLNQKLTVARINLANQSKINQTKEYIKTLGEEATKAEKQSEKDTKAIEALAELKTKLLNDLPIKGVEVKDGELFVDSIPFDRVNEARKVEIAIQIAELRSGKLPILLVDGLERLDTKTFEAFKKQAAKSKVQMIVTRVSDSALAVEA